MPTQDTGSFSATLTDTVNTTKGLNAHSTEVWDPPTVEMPLPANSKLEKSWESQHGWILLETSSVSFERREQWE